MKFYKHLALSLLTAISFASIGTAQISKYGTGAPPKFTFASSTVVPIYHGLNTDHVQVQCFTGAGVMIHDDLYIAQIVNPNTVNVTFNTTQSGWCTVNGGIGVGIQGQPGPQGNPGTPGLGVATAIINGSGHLIVTRTDSTTIDAGMVQGAPGAAGANGANGVGISSTVINGSGHLVVTKSDGSTTDVGQVVGPKGDKGDTGLTGPAGPSGAAPTWRGTWQAGVTYDVNSTVSYLGTSYISVALSLNKPPDVNPSFWNVTAAKGDPGPQGPQGTGLSPLQFGFSSATSVPIPHNYGNQNTTWACYDNSTPRNILEPGSVKNIDNNDALVTFLAPMTGYCTPNGMVGPQGQQGIAGTGAGITQLTGAVTTPANSSGSTVTTLSSVNSNVGTFGDSTHTIRPTFNAAGQVTSVSEIAINFPTGTGTNYQTVLHDGTAVTQRAKLNLTGDSSLTITATDNGTDQTNFALHATATSGSGVNKGPLSRIQVGGDLATCTSAEYGNLFVANDQPLSQNLYQCASIGWYQYGAIDASGLKFTSGALGIDTAVIPRYNANNPFTGINTFSGATVLSGLPSPASGQKKFLCIDSTNTITAQDTVCH